MVLFVDYFKIPGIKLLNPIKNLLFREKMWIKLNYVKQVQLKIFYRTNFTIDFKLTGSKLNIMDNRKTRYFYIK